VLRLRGSVTLGTLPLAVGVALAESVAAELGDRRASSSMAQRRAQ
jgi:hypothetical protein